MTHPSDVNIVDVSFNRPGKNFRPVSLVENVNDPGGRDAAVIGGLLIGLESLEVANDIFH